MESTVLTIKIEDTFSHLKHLDLKIIFLLIFEQESGKNKTTYVSKRYTVIPSNIVHYYCTLLIDVVVLLCVYMYNI